MKPFKKEIGFLAGLLVLGQIAFAFYAPTYTTPKYEGNIYATTGIVFDGSDLHKLNEAAHYFGQTMIGWTKFPHFNERLMAEVNLPEGASVSAHIQERQNIIFTVSAPAEITIESLTEVQDFLQNEINEYNATTNTEFRLTNLDYETKAVQKSYTSGAVITLILTAILGVGLLFIKKELL